MTQPPDTHLKALWRGQETEIKPMTVEAIRLRASDYQARTRRRLRMKLAGCIFGAVFFLAYAIWLSPEPTMRLGWAISALGCLWMAFQLRDRWPAALPQDASSATALLDYHRAQVLRQKLRFRSFMSACGPMFLGVIVATVGLAARAGRVHMGQLTPIGALFVIWLIAFWFLLRRQSRRLERELAELEPPRT